MKTKRSMTRSPVALIKTTLRVSRDALPPYSSKHSPKTFTQHQLFAMLVLRPFFKTDYRGLVQLLHDLPDLCNVLELTKIPHDSTLKYAQDRLLKKGRLTGSWERFSALPRRAA